jgi:hypothetical protein
MPPSKGITVPALPLASIPQSPRSDDSESTERSRETDNSIDRVMLQMTQISLSPHAPANVSSFLYKVDIRSPGHLIPLDNFLRVDGGIRNMQLD